METRSVPLAVLTKKNPLPEVKPEMEMSQLRTFRAVAETLCGGSLTPLLSHLVRAGGLSDADRKALRGLIDKMTP